MAINFENDADRFLSNENYQEIISNMNQNFSLIHFNILSLTQHFDDLLNFIDLTPNHPKIIALSETWLNQSKIKVVQIDGYNLEFANRTSSRAGGVAIYITNKWAFTRRPDLEFGFDNACESLFTEISVGNCKTKNVIIGVVYKSPHFNLESFWTLFEQTLFKLE